MDIYYPKHVHTMHRCFATDYKSRNSSNGNLIRLNFITIFPSIPLANALFFPQTIFFQHYNVIYNQQHGSAQAPQRQREREGKREKMFTRIFCYMTLIKIIIAHPRISADYLIFDKVSADEPSSHEVCVSLMIWC